MPGKVRVSFPKAVSEAAGMSFGEIVKACDEFVQNLARWKNEDIRRFILAIAQDARRTC
jgi:hypothetical protein